MISALLSALTGYGITNYFTRDKCEKLRQAIEKKSIEIGYIDQEFLARIRDEQSVWIMKSHPEYIRLNKLHTERRELMYELALCEGHPNPIEFRAINQGRR